MKKFEYRKCLFFVSMAFAMFSFSSESFGQGSVKNISFYSNSLMKNRSIQIYLPAEYDQQDPTKRYPVVYFLHGATVNQSYYTELFGILNNLIGNNLISPVILVKPDGSSGPWGGSYYTNSELYGNFEDYIVYDLTKFIDSIYNTVASKEKRAIMGHSMGAYGAMKLALKHPDIYCAVASHSGPLDFEHFPDWIPGILSENGGAPVLAFASNIIKMKTYLFYTMAGAFSPSINNSHNIIDFPLDSLGNLIDSTWNRWLLHNPTRFAKNISQNSDLAIYFDCGLQDEYLLYPFNTAFADSLDKFGLTYEFQSFTGGHLNQLINRTPIAFKFLDSVMNKTTGIYKELVKQPKTINLEQNYPNPFNSKTTIKYSVPESSKVVLKIYNLLGKEIEAIVSEEKPAGTYEVTWNAGNLTGGIYFYQLNAGGLIETRKMILNR